MSYLIFIPKITHIAHFIHDIIGVDNPPPKDRVKNYPLNVKNSSNQNATKYTTFHISGKLLEPP